MGGQVHMMFEQMYAAMPSIQGGRMRALAITSKTRSPLLPNLPTMAEQGYPAVEVLNWQGLIGPKGLPANIVKLLNSACNQALQTAEVKEKILSQGNEIGGGTPEQFAGSSRQSHHVGAKWCEMREDRAGINLASRN
jgi:tripartite-type tricarboxylate transporter receptor subunit TctC